MVDSKHKWKAWLYLSPALVLLAIFTIYPIINTIRLAFLEDYGMMKALSGASFEFGFGNFEKVVEYKNFTTCLKKHHVTMLDYRSGFYYSRITYSSCTQLD